MTSTSVFLSEFLGLYIIIVSGLFLLRYDEFVAYARTIVSDRVHRYNIAFLELAAGLGIVLTNNVWEFSYRGVITVIGVMMLLEAVFHFLASEDQELRLVDALDSDTCWRTVGFASLLLGLYLATQGFGCLL